MLGFDERSLDNISFPEMVMVLKMMTYCVPRTKDSRRREQPTFTLHMVDSYGKFPTILLETEKASVGIIYNFDKEEFRILATDRTNNKQEEFITKSTSEILEFTLLTLLNSIKVSIPKIYNDLDEMIYTTLTALRLQTSLEYEVAEFNKTLEEDDSAPLLRLRSCCGRNREREQLIEPLIPFQNTRVYVIGKNNFIDIVPTFMPDPDNEEEESIVYEVSRFFQLDNKVNDSVCWVKTVDEVWQRVIGGYFYLSRKLND